MYKLEFIRKKIHSYIKSKMLPLPCVPSEAQAHQGCCKPLRDHYLLLELASNTGKLISYHPHPVMKTECVFENGLRKKRKILSPNFT